MKKHFLSFVLLCLLFQPVSAECVDLPAMMDYISEWKQGNIDLAVLIDKISVWKSGAGCELVSGLVSHWKFDGDASDEQGNNNGAMHGGSFIYDSARDYDGSTGQVLSLNGSSYIDFGSDQSLNLTSSLSFLAWIKPNNFGSAGRAHIIDKGNDSMGPGGFAFGISDSQPEDDVATYVIYNGLLQASDPLTVNLNQWQHVALVYSESQGTITFYINGAKAGTRVYDGNPVLGFITGNPRDSTQYPLIVGIRGSDLTRGFNGKLDDIRIYNTPLSDSQILEVYNAEKPTTGTCGDNICDGTENCSTCPTDCTCPAQTPYCNTGACTECLNALHCNDNFTCTNDNCVSGACANTPDKSKCNTGETCDPTNPGANPSTGCAPQGEQTYILTQFGITWTFDKPLTTNGASGTYQYGQFVNGDYWVMNPQGGDVVIVGINPPSLNESGVIKNGAMLNPVAADDQAYDSRAAGYNASKNVAFNVDVQHPLVITEGASLISSISLPEVVGKVWVDQAAVLTILDEVPPVDSFRPPYSGYDKSIRAVKSDIDWSKLNNFSKPTDALSYSALVTHLQMDKGPWIFHWDSWWESYVHPIQNMPWYGTDIACKTGEAALALNMDYTQQEKEPILIDYLQLGIDIYGVIEAGDIFNWKGNGGIQHGRKIPVVFAGSVLHKQNMLNSMQKTGDYLYGSVDEDGYPDPTGPKNPPADYIYFQEDDQTFYVSQYDYDITHNLAPGITWNPDSRNPQPKFPYRPSEYSGLSDLGMPEWSISYATNPEESARNINTNYRSLNSVTYPATALAMHMMGLKDEWNHDALFDYADRWVNWVYGVPPNPPAGDEVAETQDYYDALKKRPPAWVWNAWFDYRGNYGCTYQNVNSTTHTRIYDCAGTQVDCKDISACQNYPNKRALDYDPCLLGC